MDFKVPVTKLVYRIANGYQDYRHSAAIMEVALSQAKEGRLHILGLIIVHGSFTYELSEFAPLSSHSRLILRKFAM